MKFREIFRFELAYQLGRVSTRLFFAIFFLLGAGIVRMGTSAAPLNAGSMIAFFTVGTGVIWLILGAAVAGDAAARDHETRVHPLMYSAPLTKGEYLGGRFLAAFLINALVLLMVPAGMLLSLYLPGVSPEARGPFRAAGYLTAYGFIALPNAFVATAVQFSAAIRSRKAISGYLASLLIMMVSNAVSTSLGSLFDNWNVAKLFDLMGLVGIIGSELETWTPIESRTRLITLEGVYLANRLMWLAIGLGTLAITYNRFRFAHPAETTRRKWFGKPQPENEENAPLTIATGGRARPIVQASSPHRAFGFETFIRQTCAITSASFRMIAQTPTGLAVVVVGALIVALFMPEFMQYVGVPFYPRTERVIQTLAAPLGDIRSPWVIIPLLTVFYAGELVWRERDAGISEIADAAPVPETVLLLGKSLGLALMLVAWMAILMAGGMLGQLLMGYHDFEIPRYLQALLGLRLVDYLLFALLAIVVQVVVNHKYVGHLAALVVYGLIVFSSTLGIQHHLLVYASDPGWTYSTMRGYGSSLAPWFWFKLYWTAWAILLAVGAGLLWVRSRESGLRARVTLARVRMSRSTTSIAGLATALLLTTGGFTFYNTNIVNKYRTASERVEQRAEYERRYGKYERALQPRLTGTKVTVDIVPARRTANIKGSYKLVNASAVALDTIHVATMSAVKTGDITFDRPARNLLTDDERGHRIYMLNTPLEPGDSLQLNFELDATQHGFRNSGYDDAVVPNGTYFKNIDWFPAIGYQPQRQVTDAEERRKLGLVARRTVPSLYDGTVSRDRVDAGSIAFEAVVSTDKAQTAIAPGLLTRSWTEGQRVYFHYVTDVPIGNEYSFFSAKYGVRKAKWNDVAIEVYYHPGHKANVERMVKAMGSALDYYTSHFGPYPYHFARFVERRGAGVGMHSDGPTMDYSEGSASLNPDSIKRGLDLVSMVVAHEVSHQWWGSQVTPAYVEGGMLLSESLANYSALMVTEKTFGKDQTRKLLSMWRQMYEEPRSRASTPLLQAADQFAGYRKGPFAMYALSQYIGEGAINVALRRVVEKYGSGKPPFPTSLDLYAELKAVTPDTLHGLLHDLYEANTFWDLETDSVSLRESASGTWQVTLNVTARKTVVDTAGVTTNVPMDDWVEIGVFEADSLAAKSPNPLYLRKHRVRSGEQTITVTVSRKPDRAGIDPRYLLLGRAMETNVRRFVRDAGMI